MDVSPLTGCGSAARWPKPFWLAVGVIVLAFLWPLAVLARFAAGSDLYSYILLVPVISVFLVWWQRTTLPSDTTPVRVWAALPAALGLGFLALAFTTQPSDASPENRLALVALAFVAFVAVACLGFLGRRLVGALTFPIGFLIFLAPMPPSIVATVESFLQHGSAAAALAMFSITGTPVFYHDLIFRLPGINLRVAPECSGIHSSIVLFMVSLVAGYLFLRSPWRRTLLAIAMIPLALLRNGFRVFVIGELCVHVSPDMIDSYIHHHGGPIFFALSMVPFFALLWWLVRSERKPGPASAQPSS